MKTKSFDIAIFETLDSKGTALLKGGFSTAYDEGLAYGGMPSFEIKITVNSTVNCACTNSCNTVAGCACSGTTASTPTQ